MKSRSAKFDIRDKSKVPINKLGIVALIVLSSFIIGNSPFVRSASALNNPEQALKDVIEDYVMTKYPEWIGYDIKIDLKYADKILEGLEEVDEDAVLSVVEVYQDFKPLGNVIFPIEVLTKDETRRIFVRAKVEVFKNVVIALRSIKRGEVIQVEDLGMESRDIASIPQRYFDHIAQVADMEAKTSIPRNSTIFEWMIKEVPLVHRGDDVLIRVTAPDLRVKVKGRALEDGYLGKWIKVRSEKSNDKEPLEGILISSSEVEVRLK
jgi:flagella basal body P-ring formation protein FlgA